jgi:large subunit ribosomal protein L13
MIINADGAILGRLAAKISKQLLKNENVIVINSEKVVISGNPKAVFKRFHEKRKIGDPLKGPYYPRYPDKILKRVVRGMIPYKKDKGRKAFRKLKVFIGNPDNLEGQKLSKSSNDLNCKFVTLGEVCKRLGAKVG